MVAGVNRRTMLCMAVCATASQARSAEPQLDFTQTLSAAGDRMGQLYVSREGRPVLDIGVGRLPDGAPVRPDHLVPWASAVKPTTVAAVMRLVERGAVRLDDPVTRHIPEFGEAGKSEVLVWHLMTHSGFLGGYDGPMNLPEFDVTVRKIMQAPRELTPSARQAGRTQVPAPGVVPSYNPAGIWILGELLRRFHNRPFHEVIRTEIFEPCGMTDSWNGMPLAQAELYGTRLAALSLGPLAFRGGDAPSSAGRRPSIAASRGAGTPPPRSRQVAPQVSPSNPAGGGVGPTHDLCRFYEMMLGQGEIDGRRVLSRKTVRDMTSVKLTDGGVWAWGLGLNLNVNGTRGGAQSIGRFGTKASRNSFGHAGASGITAFADPTHRLVIGAIPSGAVLDAIYLDLSLS